MTGFIIGAILFAPLGALFGWYQARRHPRLEFDCSKDRHMWSAVERVPGGAYRWMQGRHCELCNFDQVYNHGTWSASIGVKK
jgi:hypothetical protein